MAHVLCDVHLVHHRVAEAMSDDVGVVPEAPAMFVVSCLCLVRAGPGVQPGNLRHPRLPAISITTDGFDILDLHAAIFFFTWLRYPGKSHASTDLVMQAAHAQAVLLPGSPVWHAPLTGRGGR